MFFCYGRYNGKQMFLYSAPYFFKSAYTMNPVMGKNDIRTAIKTIRIISFI